MAEARIRLVYLDGIRAICALFVLFAHIGDGGFFADSPQSRPRILALLDPLWKYDRYAVSVFIILSGYCLMLPVVRTVDGRLQGGIRAYLLRRARRLLPPYYATLALALAVILLSRNAAAPPALIQRFPVHFTNGGLLAHLFMVHNLRSTWIFQIDGPMWSVATEWDIYFLFPCLLAVQRSSGIRIAILVAFLLGLLPHFVLHSWLDTAAPWYVGLFSLGMAGATLSFSSEPRLHDLKRRLPWGVFSAILFACLAALFAFKPARLPNYPFFLTEPIVGVAMVCFLIYSSRFLKEESKSFRPLILRILETRALVFLGTFSYSLYLIHAPLGSVAIRLLDWAPLSPRIRFSALYIVGMPILLLCCYGFHRLFERPFLSAFARQTTTRTQETTAETGGIVSDRHSD